MKASSRMVSSDGESHEGGGQTSMGETLGQ